MFSTVRTNVNALRANMYLNQTGLELSNSLARLSSGRRINSAADDAAGMFIADGLRSESSAMSQGVRNANDAIGVLNIIDKAIDEQIKLLDVMKQKAIHSAQDSQSNSTRAALQAEVLSLVDRLDSIAYGTRYNGKSLLTGGFANQEFQVGTKSHDSVVASIGPTVSQKLGNTFFSTGAVVTAASVANLKFVGLSGGRSATLAPVIISTSAGTGLGALAKSINAHADALGGVRASYSVIVSGSNSIVAGQLTNFTINGVNLGSLNIGQGDKNGSLAHAINSTTADTGIEASVDVSGKMTLRSVDGRGIAITNNNSAVTGLANDGGAAGAGSVTSYGRLTLARQGANDIILSAAGTGLNDLGLADTQRSVAGISLSGIRAELTSTQADAAGLFANDQIMIELNKKGRPGVLTLKGSMAMMDIIDTALVNLDRIRASTGAASKALSVTKSYLQSSIVETKAAESQIRDVDFAAESSTFQRNSVLAQSGNYALSQANSLAKLVTKLFN